MGVATRSISLGAVFGIAVVATHPQTEVVKFLFIPFDKVMKLINLAGINVLDQVIILIF